MNFKNSMLTKISQTKVTAVVCCDLYDLSGIRKFIEIQSRIEEHKGIGEFLLNV